MYPISTTRWRLPIFGILVALACLATAPGCTKEKINEIATSVQDQTRDLAASAEKATSSAKSMASGVADRLPSKGKLELKLQPPIETNTANIEVIAFTDGRKQCRPNSILLT